MTSAPIIKNTSLKITYSILLFLTLTMYAADQMVATAAFIDKRREDFGLGKAQRTEPKMEEGGDSFLLTATGKSCRPKVKAPWAPIAVVGNGQNNPAPTPQVHAPEIPQPVQPSPYKVTSDFINHDPLLAPSPTNDPFARFQGPTNRGRPQTLSTHEIRSQHYQFMWENEPRFREGIENQQAIIEKQYEQCKIVAKTLIDAFKHGDSYTVARCLMALEHATISEPKLNQAFQGMLCAIVYELTKDGNKNFLSCIKTAHQLNAMQYAYNEFVRFHINYSCTENYNFDLGDKVEAVIRNPKIKEENFYAEIKESCKQKAEHKGDTKNFFSCELYRSLVKINAWCSIGDFKQAWAEITRLHKKFPISCYAIQCYHEAIYNAEYRKSYTPQGIHLEYQTDPLCQSLNTSPSRSPNEALNALFARRKEAAEKTLADIGCSKDCNELTRTLAYDLIDCKNHRAAVEMLSKKLSNDHANPEVRESYNNYFYSSGVSKLTQCDPILANFDMPHEIGNAKNHELRMLLDDLATVSAHTPQIKDAVVKAFGYVKKTLADNHYSKAYETIARAINTALHDPKADQSVLQLADYNLTSENQTLAQYQDKFANKIAELLEKLEKMPQESLNERQELLQELFHHDELYKDLIKQDECAQAYEKELFKESYAKCPREIAERVPEYKALLRRRSAARADIQVNGEKIDRRAYQISYGAHKFLSSNKNDVEKIKSFLGNQYDHALHAERIRQHEIFAAEVFKEQSPWINALCSGTSRALDKASELTGLKNSAIAAKITDCGWTVVAAVDALGEKLLQAARDLNAKPNEAINELAGTTNGKPINDYLTWMGEGIINGVEGIIAKIRHPLHFAGDIEYLADKADGLVNLGINGLASAGEEIGSWPGKSPQDITLKINTTYETSKQTLNALWQNIKAITPQQWVSSAAEIATDISITNSLFKFFAKSKVLHNYANGLPQIEPALPSHYAIATTAEGIEIKVAAERASIAQMESKIPIGNSPKNPMPAMSEAAFDFASHKNPLIRNFPTTTYHESIDRNILFQAIQKFESLPGALDKDGPLTRVLMYGKDSCSEGQKIMIKGSIFELETALKLEKAGVKIEILGLKKQYFDKITGKAHGTLDIDIVTRDAYIECKNWDFASIKNKGISTYKRAIGDIKTALGVRRQLALQDGKKLELYSGSLLPPELKKFLVENNISYFEGIH
jgi:hypothetical protein